MSKLYTFEDMRYSCRHYKLGLVEGRGPTMVCTHPDNREEGKTNGPCDENACPVLRAILDDGEEWE